MGSKHLTQAVKEAVIKDFLKEPSLTKQELADMHGISVVSAFRIVRHHRYAKGCTAPHGNAYYRGNHKQQKLKHKQWISQRI